MRKWIPRCVALLLFESYLSKSATSRKNTIKKSTKTALMTHKNALKITSLLWTLISIYYNFPTKRNCATVKNNEVYDEASRHQTRSGTPARSQNFLLKSCTSKWTKEIEIEEIIIYLLDLLLENFIRHGFTDDVNLKWRNLQKFPSRS